MTELENLKKENNYSFYISSCILNHYNIVLVQSLSDI